MIVRAFLVFATLLAGFAIPALAQDEVAKSETSELIVVPFNPPLNEPLAYKVVLEKQRQKGASQMEIEQKLTFEALDIGYLLSLDMRSVSINGNRIDLTDKSIFDLFPAPVRPFLMSVQIELDPAGEPIRLRNWEAIRKNLVALPAMVADDVEGDDRARRLAAARMLLGPIISSTAEEAPQVMVRGWPTILGYGGLELEQAELYETDTEIVGDLIPKPISATVELSLSQTVSGDLRFIQSSKPAPDALMQAIVSVRERIVSILGKDASTIGSDDDPSDLSLSLTDDLDIVFEKGTGMPITAVITRATSVNGDVVRGDIVTITRTER